MARSDQFALGIKLRKQGKLEESRNLLVKLVTDCPNDPKINYQCAWAHDVLGLEREAIPFYERAIENGLSGHDLNGAFIGLGSSYRCVGKRDKAVQILRRGIEQFPSSRGIQVFLAMALHDQGSQGEAMRMLLRNLAETSTDKEVVRYKKAILFYADKFSE